MLHLFLTLVLFFIHTVLSEVSLSCINIIVNLEMHVYIIQFSLLLFATFQLQVTVGGGWGESSAVVT